MTEITLNGERFRVTLGQPDKTEVWSDFFRAWMPVLIVSTDTADKMARLQQLARRGGT